MKDVFDAAMGTFSGIIGATSGSVCCGLMIAAGIVVSCCMCSFIFFMMFSGGS